MELENQIVAASRKVLADKNRKNYYEIIVWDEESSQEIRLLEEFNEKELDALIELREKYGKKDFAHHLEEVFADPDEVSDLGGGHDIKYIDLDTPCYQYKFSRYELVGDQLVRHKALVEMTDEQYIRLLSRCVEDTGMNVNKLRYADIDLYNLIVRGVDSYLVYDGFYTSDAPYLITMDEINEDVVKVLEINPTLKSGNLGYKFV